MFNLIKKDFLTISRDRSEVLSLLAMPLILIAILSFALGGIMEGEGVDIDEIPVALVIENDFEQDIEKFHQNLIQEGLPQEAVEEIINGSQEADPNTIFLDIITSPDIEGLIDLRTDYDRNQAEEAIMTDEVFAVITLPEQFSYDTMRSIYLDEESEAVIDVLIPDNEQLYAGIIESILVSFTEQYNLEVSISKATQGMPVESEIADGFGGITNLDAARSVSSFQYYTIGMAVMFALYVASTVSSNAFKEKTSHVFARLMLTGERPLNYLISKGISATVLSILQLTILFVVSSLAFQTFSDMSSESLMGMAIVTLVFSLTIGSLATLLTAVALQFNSDAISGIFSGILVSAFAFMGGSMLPVEQFSPLLRELGNWTPNGAMMTGYLQLIQGFQLDDVLSMIYRVVAMMIIFVILAVAIFPKRRLM